MKRKPNRRSSIYLGGDGKWHGYVTMGLRDDGSPDRRHRVAATESEVTAKVRELERRRDAGTVGKPGRAPTVEEWMTYWLTTILPVKGSARELSMITGRSAACGSPESRQAPA